MRTFSPRIFSKSARTAETMQQCSSLRNADSYLEYFRFCFCFFLLNIGTTYISGFFNFVVSAFEDVLRSLF